MSHNSQNQTPPAPDPAGASQTPEPAAQAEPQQVNRGLALEPAACAEPQSIRFSRDGVGRQDAGSETKW
jgi:hypothetical protein